MKQYQFEDFSENEAWLVFRLDSQVKNQSIDIYMLMDLPSGHIVAHEIVPVILSAEQATWLFNQGKTKKGRFARRVLFVQDDPAEPAFRHVAKMLQIGFETAPLHHFENLLAEVKESYGKACFSPSTMGYAWVKDGTDELDRESMRKMVPDSYAPCSCASRKTFKFCCKPVFRELMGAMSAAENGNKSDALQWIAKARKVVGETAEVLCREAIVHSFFDPEKSREVLEKCLSLNPNHPRANYIRGIILKERGDLKGAVTAYEMAIANYPKSDCYHQNEVHNNLGTAYYEMGDYRRAKSTWEQALVFLPSDKTVRRNLTEFIYSNPLVPSEIQVMSSFVQRFFEER